MARHDEVNCRKMGATLAIFEDPKRWRALASGKVINALAPHMPMLIGGSADLCVSNNTDITDAELRS